MVRFAVISIFLAACDVGQLPGAGPDGGGGGGDSGGGGGDGGNGCVNAVTPAPQAHLHATGGGTNAGQNCMAQGCHLAGGGGPEFSFSGTVYTDSAGTTPKIGATVQVIFGTTVVAAVSDDAGNFYATQTITLPAKTLATSCPTVNPMVGMIVQGGGACNNCHRNGGTTAPVYVNP